MRNALRAWLAVCASTGAAFAHPNGEDVSNTQRVTRAAYYAAPAASFAGARAAEHGSSDGARTLRLVSWPLLFVPAFTAWNGASAGLGLGGAAVGGTTMLLADACDGPCETALLSTGLTAYTAIAALDVGWFSTSTNERSRAAWPGSQRRGWYGWAPGLGYAMLLGGVWLATVDRAGISGTGYVLAANGLLLVPVAHASAARPDNGLLALGGTLAGAGVGTAIACASGCASPYDARGAGHGLFEPGRALVGASAGIATWAAVDVALLSRAHAADESETSPPAVVPYLTTSPTTGRPRVNARVAF
jgi:hypothetical protein